MIRGASLTAHPPQTVAAYLDGSDIRLEKSGDGAWGAKGVEVRLQVEGGPLKVVLHAPGMAVQRVLLRWEADLSHLQKVIGDAWERSYGDLAWRGIEPQRFMPWYCVGWDGHSSFGWGVETGPAAFCHWHLDEGGLSLWMDVRSGGKGVRLSSSPLEICRIREETGLPGESPFAFLHRFCRTLCPKPLLTPEPIYGFNDWYYAYGDNDPDEIVSNTEMLASLCPPGTNKPFSVVDAGWSPGGSGAPPYDRGNQRFGSMERFASRVEEAGARPGIWTRPLVAGEGLPAGWRLARDHASLDPTHPEVVQYVREMIARFGEWGFEMVKHDFSSFDIAGHWGFQMGAEVTRGDWTFHDPTKTTAQAVLGLYQAIREAAGSMAVLGCNTFSHLSAGLFEACRIGDDTSGRHWDRTRRMGVNTLAFRAAQLGTFYTADPDVAAITPEVPWTFASRWLDLVSRSGTALFVSVDRRACGADQRAALKRAFDFAAKPQPLAEPLDWMTSNCPREWRIGRETVKFDWMDEIGPWPFGD